MIDLHRSGCVHWGADCLTQGHEHRGTGSQRSYDRCVMTVAESTGTVFRRPRSGLCFVRVPGPSKGTGEHRGRHWQRTAYAV